MDNRDYYAFIESVLETSGTEELQPFERQALEQELADYYQCLAELGEFDLDEAYSQYAIDQEPTAPEATYSPEYVANCLDLAY